MRPIFTLICVSLLVYGCNGTKNSTGQETVTQGITGFVGELVGNQMPGPGRELPAPKGIQTSIHVYELTSLSQVRQLNNSPFFEAISSRFIDSTQSDEKGRFSIALKPGSYSLFTRVDGKLYANTFDQNNHISPAVVNENVLTEVNITVSDKASF
jgi:hypothetical protein